MSRPPIYSSQNVSQGNSQGSEYYGLINQGATCYLNSVLQVLFMTEGFREAVSSKKNKHKGAIDRQLCTLFTHLTNGIAETTGVTRNLGIKKVNEQHDAAECFERILAKTNDKASQIFKGQLTYKTVWKCNHTSDESISFWNLPLPLTSHHEKTYTVVDGIQDFFADSQLSGENQLYCESCGNKCDATVQCKLKRHPEVVMLLLKRFEFNYHHKQYMKNSLPVEVSLVITLPGNQTYELYAVVEHFGTLKSGHYMATIKPQNEERWFEFNDFSVTLPNQHKIQLCKLQKSKNAYLLFYRKTTTTRKTTTSKDTGAQDGGERKGLCSQTTSVHINDSGNPAKKSSQSSNWQHKDQNISPQNTDDSSTSQQNQCERKDKSGNGKSRDKKAASFYHNRSKPPVLKRSHSCANTSKNGMTKSSLKNNQSQKRSSGVKAENIEATYVDTSQKEQNTNGDDDEKDNHLLTAGRQQVESMKEGDQSHGEMITQNTRTAVARCLPRVWFSVKFNKRKQKVTSEKSESAEAETSDGFSEVILDTPPPDSKKRDKKGTKEKREESPQVNGEKQKHKCCIC